MVGCKGPGTERLSLESLFRPAAAHLVGDDAFDVVLDVNYVYDGELVSAAADVFKVAVVAVALEPGDGRLIAGLRADGEVQILAAVELK